MDIDWESGKQGCWIALQAYRILHRIKPYKDIEH